MSKVYEVLPFTNEEEWHAHRNKLLTASDVATWVGVNPFQKRQDVIDTKRGIKPRFAGNEHTERGKRWEQPIIEEYSRKHMRCRKAGMFCRSLRLPALGCTPDAIGIDDFGDKYIVEIKCPSQRSKYKWGAGPPLMYIYQVHTQMLVTGYTRGKLVAGFPDEETGEIEIMDYEVEMDGRIVNAIITSAWEFANEFKIK